ncbi:MAG: polysaccharide biosynthesis tyrosine autokinase [Psychromonas sp.]|nr:polysaccharide biosynthesis tyrosine autokinase [Psychromonas sp.]
MLLENKYNQGAMTTIKEYWLIVMKSKGKIILFVLFSTLLATLIVISLPPVYRATSSLLIKASKDHTVSIDSVYSIDPSRKDYFLTQFEILKSRAIAEKVIEELKLDRHEEFLPSEENLLAATVNSLTDTVIKNIKKYIMASPSDIDVESGVESERELRSKKVKLINNFQKKLSITPIRNTQIVEISFDAEDPLLAALVANSISDVYIKEEMSAQLNLTQKAVDWLKLRLEKLRSNLESSMDELQAYRIKENLIDIESRGVRSMASDELENLTESYLQAKKARFEAETIYYYVNNLKSNDLDSLLSLPEISNHRLIEGIKSVEIEAEKKVSELSYRYGKKHPKYIAAKAELFAVRKNLQQNVNKLVKGISKELKAAKDNERRLFNELKIEKRKFQDVTTKEQEYLKLQREVEANRNLYNTFLARYKEMDSTTDLQVQQARVVDPAEVPLLPVRPQKMLIILLTLLGSLILAIILTFIFDSLNDKFRTPDDVESKLGMRLLGLLPMIKVRRNQHLSAHAYFDNKNRAFAEAVRTLRTSFMLSHANDNNKVVLVTSSIPGEGKSTTAINIAFAIAQMEKTLLIEADMRRPSFTKVFDLPAYQEGLSNAISSTENLEHVIIRDEQSNVDILPAGFIPENPLELLSSSKFNALLTILKSKYDRIIIDSPPIQAVSDVLVLAQQCDSVIYVVRSEMTTQAVVKQGLSRLLQVTSKVDGIVLNRVDIKKHSKEGSYQGYYDHYGYAKEGTAQK